jgi:hypothetical protein
MPQKAAKYLHRKCRREACGKWSLFRADDRKTAECVFCGNPFGRLEVGLDVQDTTTAQPEPMLRVGDAKPLPAVKLPDVKPGDFEYVDPKR